MVARARRIVIVCASASVLALVPCETARAQSETKKECVGAFDRAQQLRMEGKLRSAREALVVCGKNECPTFIRQDCVQWMSEVLAALPSVVVGARDGQGHDVVAVKVSIDGTVVQEKLEGKPVPVDPGVHTFRYETAGAAPIEEQVVVREGEKNRPLTVTFPSPPGSAPTPPLATPTPTQTVSPAETRPARHHSSANTVVGVVLASLGLVGLGGALYFDLSANSDATNLNNTCKPNCSQAAVDNVRTKYVYAGVSLGAGIVAVGVGVFMLVARPILSTDVETRHAATVRLDARPTTNGGVVGVTGEF